MHFKLTPELPSFAPQTLSRKTFRSCMNETPCSARDGVSLRSCMRDGVVKTEVASSHLWHTSTCGRVMVTAFRSYMHSNFVILHQQSVCRVPISLC